MLLGISEHVQFCLESLCLPSFVDGSVHHGIWHVSREFVAVAPLLGARVADGDVFVAFDGHACCVCTHAVAVKASVVRPCVCLVLAMYAAERASVVSFWPEHHEAQAEGAQHVQRVEELQHLS